jgi:protein-S-isoprenylcysteine O-methyltransferase Ste14
MPTPAPPDHAEVRVLPPLLFAVSTLLGVGLGFVCELRFATQAPWRVPLGLALLALGVVPGVWAMLWMRRTRQHPDPRRPTPELIVGGPFRFSRNPIYLGLALLQAGIGLSTGNLWILLLLAPTLWILQREVIEKEEAYLERKFGDAFRVYQGSVRRWL